MWKCTNAAEDIILLLSFLHDIVLGVPKAPLECSDSLEGLTGLREALTDVSQQRRKCKGDMQEKPVSTSQVSPAMELHEDALHLPETV